MAITYNIQFNADTKSLQSQLATVQKDLSKAFNVTLNTADIDVKMSAAVRSAQVLERALTKATTINGTAFSALNAELRKANMSAGELVTTLSGAQMRESASMFINTFTYADRSALVLSGRIKEMGRVLAQSFKFTTAQAFLRFMDSALQSGVQWSKDMNKALTDIAIVTGAVGEDLDRIFNQVLTGAQQLKVAAREYAEAALIFYQQGLGEEEVAKRTDVTIKAAKAAGQSTKEMSEQLTAVWNTYQMQGERLENAASIGARLGAETAVDFKYIAEAMQTSASAAAQLGVSYESLTAIIATVGETTLQSASTVGNAYKTIFSRFANLKTTGEDQGVTLGRISQQFADMGINILDAAGELRELDDVIMEVGQGWDNYSTKQQQAIAQIAGGTRQFGQFLALMNNFDKYQENLQSATSETGDDTLEQQFETWSQSIEAVANRSKEAWAQAFAEMFQQDSIKGFYTMVEGLGNLFGGLINGMGGLPGILSAIALIMQKQILTSGQNMLKTSIELIKNATLQGRIDNSNAKLAEMRSTTNKAIVNSQNIAQKQELQLLKQKVIASQEVNETVIRLQNLRDKGNAQQQQEASTQLQLLEMSQQRYFAAMDEQRAAELELKVLQDLKRDEATLSAEQKKQLDMQIQAAQLREKEAGRRVVHTRDAFRGARDDAGRVGEQDPAGAKKWAGALMGVATSAMTATFAISSLMQMMESGEASFGQIIGLTMSLSMSIVSLIPAFQLLNATVITVSKSIVAGGISAQAAWWWVAAIVAAIAALTAVAVLAFQQMKANSPEGKLEAAKKTAASLAEEVNKTKEEAEALKETFSQYDSVVDELNNCIRGTDEWRDALKKVNDVVLEILSNNPQLAKMEGLFSRNADGMLELNEDMRQDALDAADKRVERAQASSSLAGARVSSAQNTVDAKNLTQELTNTTGFLSVSKALTEAASEIGNSSNDFETEVRKVLQQQVDAGYIYEYQVDGLVAQAMKQEDAFRDLANSTEEAARQMDTITQLLAQQELGDEYNAAEQNIAAQQLETRQQEIYDSILKLADRDQQRDDQTTNSLDLLRRYNEATGNNYKAADNLVRGNDSDRYYAVYDAMGELVEITKEQMATQIAAGEALQELGQSAEKARENLAKLDEQVGSQQADLLKTIIGGGSLGQDTKKSDFEALYSAVGGSTSEDAMNYLTEQAEEMGVTIEEFAQQYGMNSAEEFAKVLANNLSIKEGWDNAISNLDTKGIDIAISELSYAAAKGLSDTFDKLELGIYGEKAGESFVTGLNTVLANVDPEDKIAVIENLADIDWENWDLNTGIDSLSAMTAELENIETAAGKFQWLENYNNKIKDLNNEMQIMSEVTGIALPQLGQLGSSFFNLSEAAQKTQIAEQEVAMATSNVELAQLKLNNAMEQAEAIRARFSDDVEQKWIDLLNNRYESGGLEAVQAEIDKQVEAVELDPESAKALQDFYNEIANGQMTVEQMNFSLEDAKQKLAKVGAELKVASLGITDFDQAVKAFNNGLLSTEELTIVAPNLIQDVNDLIYATETGIISATEFTQTLQGLEYTISDLDIALQKGFISIDAYNNMSQDLAEEVIGGEKAFDEFVNVLGELNGEMKDAETGEYSDSLKSVAKDALLADKAASDLLDVFENFGKTLKKNKKEMSDDELMTYASGLSKLKTSTAQLLGIMEGDLPNSFFENAKNLELIEKAANGSEEALSELRNAAANQILLDILVNANFSESEIAALMDKSAEIQAMLDSNPLRLGATVDFDETALNNFVSSAFSTAAEAQSYFDALGYEPEITVTSGEIISPVTATITESDPPVIDKASFSYKDPQTGDVVTGYKEYVKSQKSWTREVAMEPHTETVTAPTILPKGSTASANADFKVTKLTKKTGQANGNTKPSSGGGGKKGGGGGGSKAKEVTGEAKKYAERYRDINDALAELARRMDKVNAASDKAFGKNKLRLLAQNNALLQEQARLNQELEKEARNYLSGTGGRPVEFGNKFLVGNDQDVLKQMTSSLGLGEALFDEDGFVKNAGAIKAAAEDLANTVLKSKATYDETKGAWIFGTDEAGEANKKYYEDLTKSLDDVISQVDTVNDSAQHIVDVQKEQLEIIHNWLSNKIAETDLKLELRVRVNEMDLKNIEFLLGRLGDRAKGISLDYLNDSADLAIDKGWDLIFNYERLDEIIKNINTLDPTNIQNQDFFEETFGLGAWDEFLANGGAYTQEMMDNLADKADQMREVIDQLYDYSAQIFGSYREMLDIYISDFDNLISRFDNSATEIEAWTTLWQVAGESMKNRRMEIDLMSKSIDTQTSKVKGMQQQYQFLQGQLENAERVYLAAQAAHGDNDKITQDALQSWKDLQNQVEETGASVMSEIANIATMFEEKAAKMAEVIRHEFNSALDGLFADVSSFGDMFSQKDTIDKFFMHTEDLGYELGNLLDEAMANPDALKDAAKWEQYLNSLIEKKTVQTEVLGEMREHDVWVTKDGVQLTEKQLEIIKEQFELEKEQAAFADQQAAKNTMRLARDASGNWSYVYSADTAEAEDQAKDIEDRLVNIRKLHREAVDELTNFWVDQMTQWEEFEANVDQKRYEQDEKYREQVDKQRAWYQEMMATLSSQIELHLGSIDMDFNETTLSTILNLEDMGEANDIYTQNILAMSQSFRESWKQNQEELKARLEEMGIDMDDFENTVRVETDKIMAKNEENEASIKHLRNTAESELAAMTSDIEAWSQKWQSEISVLIERLRALIETIRELHATQSADFDRNTDYAGKIQETVADENMSNAEKKARVKADAERRWYKIVEARELLDREEKGEKIDWSIYRGGKSDALNIANEWGSDLTSQSREKYVQEWLDRYNFDTGGLATGPQVAGLAMDGKKEIVLNASDTENFLEAISIMRDGIAAYLSNIGMKQAGLAGATHPQTSDTASDQPPVIIQADFPNVTAREEIEAAFANLVNQAAQYKLKPRD